MFGLEKQIRHNDFNSTDQRLHCIDCVSCLQIYVLQTGKFSARLFEIFTIIIWYAYERHKNINFISGPPRLPFFGSYLFLLLVNYKHLHKAVETLCKYYKTDVLGLYIADTPTIVAHTTESAKLCLTHRDFDGKPQLLIAKMRDPDFKFRGESTLHFE